MSGAANSSGSTSRNPRRGIWASFWARRWAIPVFIVAFLVPLAINHAGELWQELAPSSQSKNDLFSTSFWYQRLVTLGFRKPRPRAVTLVPLSEEDLGQRAMTDKCFQRRYLAKLITRIKDAHPAVVMLDKWFNPDNCTADGDGTRALQGALTDIASTATVVVGIKTLTTEGLADERPGDAAQLAGRKMAASLFIQPSLFAYPTPLLPPRVVGGLIRLDLDTLRLPTRWTAFRSIDSAKRGEPPERFPSISLAAAEAFDPGLEQDLDARLKSSHPFASFIEEDLFPSIKASSLTCGSAADTRCADPLPSSLLRLLSHRIVVIGERSAGDFHESPFGRIAGFTLQANYIEALLDNRLLRPVATWLQLAALLIWFLVIEIIFEKEPQPEKAMAFSVLVTGLCIGFIYFVLIVYLGLFLSLWPSSIIALLSKYAIRKSRAFAEDLKKRHTRGYSDETLQRG